MKTTKQIFWIASRACASIQRPTSAVPWPSFRSKLQWRTRSFRQKCASWVRLPSSSKSSTINSYQLPETRLFQFIPSSNQFLSKWSASTTWWSRKNQLISASVHPLSWMKTTSMSTNPLQKVTFSTRNSWISSSTIYTILLILLKNNSIFLINKISKMMQTRLILVLKIAIFSQINTQFR